MCGIVENTNLLFLRFRYALVHIFTVLYIELFKRKEDLHHVTVCYSSMMAKLLNFIIDN